MTHRHWGCGPRGRIEIDVPEAVFAMGRGRSGSWGPFHFEFDDNGWGGGRRRGGRNRRMVESGELRLLLLMLIAEKPEKPRHGYDLIRAIETLTGGEYAPSPGVVYPTLTLLQDMGLIEEIEAEGTRKAYQATAEGKAHLEENAEEVSEIFGRIADLKPRERVGGSPIGRAIKNLMMALRHRIEREGFHEDLLHEIAEILDEAAQRIERVKPSASDS